MMRTWENGRDRRVTVDFRGTQLVFLFAIFDYPVGFSLGHYEKV
jgi:hypothetical protein